MNDQLVIVSAHYDTLPGEPDGTLYAGANDNGSGLAVLLEVARLWQEQGLTPRRGVLFAAWAGGELDQSGSGAFINGYLGGISLLNPVAIFQLDNLGAGDSSLRLETNSDRLDELVAQSASQLGLSLRRGGGSYHPYQEFLKSQTQSALISWDNSQAIPEDDVIERIRPEKLSSAGETVILTLTNAVRLPDY